MKPDDASRAAALPEIVRRAAAILAQQAPFQNTWPALNGVGGAGGGQGAGIGGVPLSVDELRQRAMQFITDFFAWLGPMSELHTALATAIASMPHSGLPTVPFAPGPPNTFSTPPNFPAAMSALPAIAPLASGMASLLWQSAPAPVRAGEAVTLPLQAENRLAQPVQASFFSTDLLSDNGRSIPGYQVSFQPPNATLRPGERRPVGAKIEIPLQSVPGTYTGLVQAAGLPDTKAVITIQVA